MLNIGDKLKLIRETLEITQVEVSKNTGINSKTLSGYENNVSYPDLDTFRVLMIFYGVSADTVLEISQAKFNDYKTIQDNYYSDEEKQFIELYRKLPNNMKIEIKGEIKGILRATQEEQSASLNSNENIPNKKAI